MRQARSLGEVEVDLRMEVKGGSLFNGNISVNLG